jgi:AP-3 complex subunit delta-1
MSLLYECINAVIVGGMLDGEGGDALAATCVDKLAAFLDDVDQNLRYMALLALNRLLPTHPGLVAKHYDTILHCVGDPDITIRSRALNLIDGMVDRSNLQDIVSQLMRHLSSRSRPGASSSAALEALASASRGDAAASTSTATPAYRKSLIGLII